MKFELLDRRLDSWQDRIFFFFFFFSAFKFVNRLVRINSNDRFSRDLFCRSECLDRIEGKVRLWKKEIELEAFRLS